jgi:hypothetical protein
VKIEPQDLKGLKTYSLFDRHSKVTTDHFGRPVKENSSLRTFMASLPDQLLGHDFPELICRLARAHRAGKPIIMGMGAHVIKVGLNPLLIDLMQRSIITGLAMNGACIVHDAEIAMAGSTSEEVGDVLGNGAFGAARETAEVLNAAIAKGAREEIGMGQAVGEYLLSHKYPHNDKSLLATAAKLEIPVTVHVAMGTDIIHIHPSASGADIGETSHRDFRLFCSEIAGLQGGAYLNVGSAVLLPEVFLKALTLVRNLGNKVDDFTTANFDFVKQYRPLTNVVNRPTAGGGKGYHITGHHELMIPLLAASLLDELSESC